jgi:hypothetical protein
MNDETIRAMAEQAYLFHLLVKTLRENGHLEQGLPASLYSKVEFEHFLEDYRNKHFPKEP